MFARTRQLNRIEARLEEAAVAADSLRQHVDAIRARLILMDDRTAELASAVQAVMAARAEHDAAVADQSRRAATAAEAAFVGVQTLAAAAAAQPAPPLPAETQAAKPRTGKM